MARSNYNPTKKIFFTNVNFPAIDSAALIATQKKIMDLHNNAQQAFKNENTAYTNCFFYLNKEYFQSCQIYGDPTSIMEISNKLQQIQIDAIQIWQGISATTVSLLLSEKMKNITHQLFFLKEASVAEENLNNAITMLENQQIIFMQFHSTLSDRVLKWAQSNLNFNTTLSTPQIAPTGTPTSVSIFRQPKPVMLPQPQQAQTHSEQNMEIELPSFGALDTSVHSLRSSANNNSDASETHLTPKPGL